MTDTEREPVYFNDGCVKARDYIYIAAKVVDVNPDEHDFSRMFFYKDPQWAHWDRDWRVVSVEYFRPDNTFYTMSDQGEIGISSPSGLKVEKIDDAGTYQTGQLGAVKQIRHIGKHIYACGDQGQVYRREKKGWVHFDAGVLDRKMSPSALDLNGIDGTSDNDIYVVGMHGRIWHYDGSHWTELESPTNVHLERVRCVSPDEVYFCGNSGVFLKKTAVGFEDHSVPDLDEHFWGLESYSGRVYLASLSGLHVFDGVDVRPADTGIKPPIGGYRLAAGDGVLWSFGVDDLACFDGKTWRRLDHPDNI